MSLTRPAELAPLVRPELIPRRERDAHGDPARDERREITERAQRVQRIRVDSDKREQVDQRTPRVTVDVPSGQEKGASRQLWELAQ